MAVAIDDKPLKLQTTANGWIIYSVGPHLIDDHGKPFDVQHRTGDLVFEYTERAANDAPK